MQQECIGLWLAAFREVFELFDSNGGGTIDADELDQTLRSLEICLSHEEIKDVLKTIDVDGEINYYKCFYRAVLYDRSWIVEINWIVSSLQSSKFAFFLGNGEIDFCEFLHLMTNTKRFLESVGKWYIYPDRVQ